MSHGASAHRYRWGVAAVRPGGRPAPAAARASRAARAASRAAFGAVAVRTGRRRDRVRLIRRDELRPGKRRDRWRRRRRLDGHRRSSDLRRAADGSRTGDSHDPAGAASDRRHPDSGEHVAQLEDPSLGAAPRLQDLNRGPDGSHRGPDLEPQFKHICSRGDSSTPRVRFRHTRLAHRSGARPQRCRWRTRLRSSRRSHRLAETSVCFASSDSDNGDRRERRSGSRCARDNPPRATTARSSRRTNRQRHGADR